MGTEALHPPLQHLPFSRRLDNSPLMCHQLLMWVNKPPEAPMPPCAPSPGVLVRSPQHHGLEWVHRARDEVSFDAAGLFTNDVRYPVLLGAAGTEQRRVWVCSACQTSPGSAGPKCSFTFPSSRGLFHPFFDLPLPLLLLLFFFQRDLLLCASGVNPFIPPCPRSGAGGSCLGRWVISKVKQHLGFAPSCRSPPSLR